jgi:hypothetical protein
VYTLVPILWAFYNAIPPALFFIYFFTKVAGKGGEWMGGRRERAGPRVILGWGGHARRSAPLPLCALGPLW